MNNISLNNTSLIYQNDVKETLETIKKSVNTRADEKPDNTSLSKIMLLIGFIAFKTKTTGIKAAVASLGVNMIYTELSLIVKLGKKIWNAHQDLKKINQLQGLVSSASKEVNQLGLFVERKEAIENNIEQVNTIVTESKEYFSGAKSKAKWSLALRVVGVAGIVLGGVGVVALSKPFMIAGGAIYLVSHYLIPRDYYSDTKIANMAKKINDNITAMINTIDIAQNPNQNQPGKIYFNSYSTASAPQEDQFNNFNEFHGGYPVQGSVVDQSPRDPIDLDPVYISNNP